MKIRGNRIIRMGTILMAMALLFAVCTVSFDQVHAATSAPAKVKNVKLSKSTTSTLKIKWGQVKSANKYQLAYKRVGTDEFKKVTTTKCTYTISSLKQDTTYFIKVRAKKGNKYGKWSDTKQYKTKVNYKKAAAENKMKVTVYEDTIKIKISPLDFNGEATLYRVAPNNYLTADKNSGIVTKNVKGSKVATFYMDDANTFTISRRTSSEYDKAYDKFYIVYEGAIIKGPVYATNIASEGRTTRIDVPSKKGIVDELTDQTFDVAADLGANWTAMNIDFTQLILADGTSSNSIEVNGKTYYMNDQYVRDMDFRLSKFEQMGINVIGIVISFVNTEVYSNYPDALKYIDDARWTNGFNTSTNAGRDYFIACMEFLADRYSQRGNGLICNYVIDNFYNRLTCITTIKKLIFAHKLIYFILITCIISS